MITGDAPIAHPAGDALVLEVRRTGGLRPAGADFADVPVATVLGDGRMIVEGAQIQIYPPPILPPLFELRLTQAGLQQLLRAADSAGLLSSPPDYGRPAIADATTTVITVHAGGREVVHEIYALTEAGDLPGLSEEQRERRRAVAQFVGGLTAPERDIVDPDEASDAQPYEADRFAIRATTPPLDRGAPPEVEPEVVDWPLPDVDLDAAADCLVVEGDAARALAEVLARANTLTRFAQDGLVYGLQVRPLLPHEAGCEP